MRPPWVLVQEAAEDLPTRNFVLEVADPDKGLRSALEDKQEVGKELPTRGLAPQDKESEEIPPTDPARQEKEAVEEVPPGDPAQDDKEAAMELPTRGLGL